MKKVPLNTIKGQILILFVASLAIISICTGTYFLIYSQILQNRAKRDCGITISQALDKVSALSAALKTSAAQVSANHYTQLYLTSGTPEERIAYSRILYDSIFKLTDYQDGVDNISLIDGSGSILAFPKQHYQLIDTLISDFRLLDCSGSQGIFSKMIHDNLDNKDYLAYFEPVFSTYTGNITKRIGTCVVLTEISNFTRALKDVSAGSNTDFILADRSGRIVTLAAPEKDAEAVARLSGAIDRIHPSGEISQSGYLAQWQTVAGLGWTLTGVVPLRQITSQLLPFLISSSLLFILVMAVLIILYVRILRGIAKPIVEVSEFMQHYSDAAQPSRIKIRSYKEIQILAERCNSMLDSLQKTNDDNLKMQSNMYELRLSLKQAELSALRSQINPHFLYNTLDCLKGYGYLLGSKEVTTITSDLSSLLRYAVKGPDLVCVRDEISCVRSYLSIIDIRYENRFAFSVECAEEAASRRMPRFILQPLVENAVYHGLEPKTGGGCLRVRASAAGSRLSFDVDDDGCGMSPEQLAQVRELIAQGPESGEDSSAQGIGLSNIARRLRLSCGSGSVFTVDSLKGQYTRIHIEITEPPEGPGEEPHA